MPADTNHSRPESAGRDLDASFTSIRRPRVLRQEVVQMMNPHSVADKPLMYTWTNNQLSGDVQRLD